jgi:hypothetical protein
MKTLWIGMMAVMVLIAVGSAYAEDLVLEPTSDVMAEAGLPEIDLRFRTHFLIQSDRDFDDTEPLYKENGQSVGAFTTVFEPGLTWFPIDAVALRYQAYLEGVWSRHDAEGRDPAEDDQWVLQHQELWAEFYDRGFGIRTGFQNIADPTELFVQRHIGAVKIFYDIEPGQIYAIAGQFPDTVYEGTGASSSADELSANNFEDDVFLFGLGSEWALGLTWDLDPALFFLWDRTEIDRPLAILNAAVHADGDLCERMELRVDLAGQWGRHEKAGLFNHDVEFLAAAAQAGLTVDLYPAYLGTHLVALTSDDGDRYDQYDTGYTYSGKSIGRTLFLSENWMLDQYDNLDERAAAQRAGLFMADQEIGVNLTETFRLYGIVGYGMALDADNVNSDRTLATEADLGLSWAPVRPYVNFTLIGGGLWPGRTGALLQNEIDLDATVPIYHGQAMMELAF